MKTIQAKRVQEALEAIGLKHGSFRTNGDFTVRTDVERKRDWATKKFYSEYGDATASIAKSGEAVAIENAERLVSEFGLHVVIVENTETSFIHIIVSSKYNPQRGISRSVDGEWSFEPVNERGE